MRSNRISAHVHTPVNLTTFRRSKLTTSKLVILKELSHAKKWLNKFIFFNSIFRYFSVCQWFFSGILLSARSTKKRNFVNDQAKNLWTPNFIFHIFEHKLRTNKAVIKAIKSLHKHK